MRVLAASRLVGIVCVLGCAPGAEAPRAAPPVNSVERPRGVLPREPPHGEPGPVGDRGVGEFVLGEALPADRLDRDALARAYVTTLYSDAQPLEGFAFEGPKVTVMVRGAFHRWGQDRPFDKAPTRVKEETLRRVLAKKLTVDMIVITAPGVRTDRGIGVGDTKESFERAYPEVRVGGFPPLWEEPTCVGMLGHLAFFFRCTLADAQALPPSSPIVRIAVFIPLEEREAREQAAKAKPAKGPR